MIKWERKVTWEDKIEWTVAKIKLRAVNKGVASVSIGFCQHLHKRETQRERGDRDITHYLVFIGA